MRYHKLKAGECPGTYVVTEPVTEQDLLRIANQIARKRLAKRNCHHQYYRGRRAAANPAAGPRTRSVRGTVPRFPTSRAGL